MANNILVMNVQELEAAIAHNLANIVKIKAQIAEGNLDARNLKNFKRFVSMAQQRNDLMEYRIAKLNAAE
tara:strand:+ start:4105 stop:4314 length:210 start_codon:yes stop_codon:yes gene_type:complete